MSSQPKRGHGGASQENKTKKTSASLDREAKRQRMVAEKTAKKTANEMNKIYKPGECMKYMNVEAHPNLLSAWYMADLGREVTSSGARLVSSPSTCHPALLLWTRTVPQSLETNDGLVKLTPPVESCGRALYVTTAEEIEEHVAGHALTSHVRDMRELADCDLTLIVFGVQDYFKSARRKNSSRTKMTEITLEMAIIDVMVSAGCDTMQVETPNELALLIVHFTKAIAEAPFKKAKRACDDQAEYYMRGDSKKCVAVDKSGAGVSRLWQQMLAVLPMSSLETSRALCAQYKTPRALFEAFEHSDGLEEVANVGVARAAVPGAKSRRIGPEFARKLRTLFTAQDGNALVE